MGGGPNIQQVNPAQVVQAILNGFKQEYPLYQKFSGFEPNLVASDKIAAGITSALPGQEKQLQSLLTGLPSVSTLTDPLQKLLSGMPSVTGITNPLQAALNRDAGIVSTGGRMTAGEAASLNAPLTAELGQAGMGHTAPGVFSQAMNTYQEMQNRVNTAIGQETQLAPAIETIRGKDVEMRSMIPQTIEGLRGTDIGMRTGLEQAMQGLGTTALGANTAAEAAQIGDFSALLGNFSGPISSQMLANQQAQAASASAGANKNAGIGSGLLSGLSTIGAASILAG